MGLGGEIWPLSLLLLSRNDKVMSSLLINSPFNLVLAQWPNISCRCLCRTAKQNTGPMLQRKVSHRNIRFIRPSLGYVEKVVSNLSYDLGTMDNFTGKIKIEISWASCVPPYPAGYSRNIHAWLLFIWVNFSELWQETEWWDVFLKAKGKFKKFAYSLLWRW